MNKIMNMNTPQVITRFIFGSVLSLSLVLTGCAGMTSQSQTIPQNVQQQLSTQQPIISYFSKTANEQDCGCASSVDQSYSLIPIEDGYYRILLGRDKDGRFLVQDFYQKTKTPQSSPVWIKDPMGLFSFDSQYVVGPVTLYFPDGKISYQGQYEDGHEVGASQSFYKNGQLGAEYTIQNEVIKQRLWYPNGNKAAELTLSNDDSYQITDGKYWNEQGQTIDNEEQQTKIIDQIYADLDEDIN